MGGIFSIAGDYFLRAAGAVVILLVGLVIGLVVRKVLKKVLKEIELDKTIKKLGKDYSLEKKISSLAAYLVYLITLFLVLEQLRVTSVVLYIILGAVLLLVGLTFFIGIKDFLPNLIGGIIVYRKGYKVGRKIKVNGRVEGKIEKMGLLEMEVKTEKGDKIYVPNSLLIKSKVWMLGKKGRGCPGALFFLSYCQSH